MEILAPLHPHVVSFFILEFVLMRMASYLRLGVSPILKMARWWVT